MHTMTYFMGRIFTTEQVEPEVETLLRKLARKTCWFERHPRHSGHTEGHAAAVRARWGERVGGGEGPCAELGQDGRWRLGINMGSEFSSGDVVCPRELDGKKRLRILTEDQQASFEEFMNGLPAELVDHPDLGPLGSWSLYLGARHARPASIGHRPTEVSDVAEDDPLEALCPATETR